MRRNCTDRGKILLSRDDSDEGSDDGAKAHVENLRCEGEKESNSSEFSILEPAGGRAEVSPSMWIKSYPEIISLTPADR